jgi:hypothetical protein
MAFTHDQYITELRLMLQDEDGSKNILNKKMPQYNDAQLEMLLRRALSDINTDAPATDYSLEEFPQEDLILLGATIFACIMEGMLQLRNQVDYNDAGLSISMFNKTGGYQGWAGFLLQYYIQQKNGFKRGVIANQTGAGFFGIRSQFSRDWGAWQ